MFFSCSVSLADPISSFTTPASSDMSNKNEMVVRPMVDHLVLHSGQAQYMYIYILLYSVCIFQQ